MPFVLCQIQQRCSWLGRWYISVRPQLTSVKRIAMAAAETRIVSGYRLSSYPKICDASVGLNPLANAELHKNYWCDLALGRKKHPLPRAKIAMSSMRGWHRSIDAEKPDLSYKTVNQCYEANKLRTRLRRYMKVESELLPMDEGDTSFWSDKLHCRVTGDFDNKGVFIPPDWGAQPRWHNASGPMFGCVNQDKGDLTGFRPTVWPRMVGALLHHNITCL